MVLSRFQYWFYFLHKIKFSFIYIFRSLYLFYLLLSGSLISQCTLRLMRPECTLSSHWSAEPLAVQSKRSIESLHASTGPLVTKDQFTNQTLTEHRPFCAPTFAYCFPLLRLMLVSDGGEHGVGGDEETAIKCLIIIAEHARLRAKAGEQEVAVKCRI